MKDTKRALLHGALGVAIAAALLAGCSKKDDPIVQAQKQEAPASAQAAAGVPAPGIAEVKAIAEEGFIYGLPIVMNYAVMYEYVIDKNSGQFKAPFNQIHNEARVFTYEDTAIVTPNSDTPYSVSWMDLRAEPMVITVPAVDPQRYYSVVRRTRTRMSGGVGAGRATLPATRFAFSLCKHPFDDRPLPVQ